MAWASMLGEEKGLAFLHDLQQNHGHEGRTINQAVCGLRLGEACRMEGGR